jgi:hypothetical protein
MGGVIYNVTVKVEKSIADKWLQWLIEDHAPRIIATDCFTKFTALKLLELDDDEGITYAIQYFAEDLQAYERYIAQYADEFRKQASDKWGEKFIAFRTLMQVVN